jgi:hypothetical protein
LFKYFESRKTEEDQEQIEEPVKITPRRLRLAFRRANAADPEKLAA